MGTEKQLLLHAISIDELKELLRDELKSISGAESSTNTNLSIEQAATFLCVSKPALYQLTHRKKIPFMKIGKRLVFQRSALLRWQDKITIEPV